jgi:hypothetical protein
MTVEELFVERYIQMEKKVADLEEVIEDKEELLEQKRDEIFEYENLVSILKKHLSRDKYGITIELKNYIEKDKDDLDFLCDFFELGEEKEETQGEG